MIGKFLKRLFAGDPAGPVFDRVDYKGCSIQPDPIREGDLWRVAAEIRREHAGEIQVHRLIRADTMPDPAAAAEMALAKARLVIDQQGERLFDP